jgi:anti-sigma factor RsiW
VTCPDPVATGLAAYVLDALEPEERRRVEEHVSVCPACAAELAEFKALPALLARVRPADLEPVSVAPSPDLFERTAAAAAGTDWPRRLRSRTWAVVAAVVLAVLGIGVGVTVWATGGGEQTATAAAGPVRATVTASPANDGVALEVAVAGLHPGETCRIVVIDRDGDRHPGGQWPVSPAGNGRWVGWAAVDPGTLDDVVLLGAGGRELVRVDL